MVKLVFEDTSFFHKYAVLENNALIYLEIIEKDKFGKLGDIYLAKVENVVKGLSAAFLDLGGGTGFLPFQDRRIVKGDKLIVQVVKEGDKSKKPKLSSEISLKGRYSVFLPYENTISISKKISDIDMSDIVDKLKLNYENKGIILRTESAKATYEDICEDINYLLERYDLIKSATDVGILLSDNKPEFKILELIEKFKVEDISTNSEDFYKGNKLKFLKRLIKIDYKENYCFNYSGINLKNLLSHNIKFDNFSIFVQKTEAMTVIDIDSGYIKQDKIKDSQIYEVNKEAVDKIFELIDILDIGGIIVVDLINMTQLNKEKLDFYLQNVVKSHKKKVRVSPVTKNNLLEIIRQKSNNSVVEILTENCRCCQGSGRVYKDKLILDEFELDLKNSIYSGREEIRIALTENLYIRIKTQLLELEKKYNCHLNFIKDDNVQNIKIIIN